MQGTTHLALVSCFKKKTDVCGVRKYITNTFKKYAKLYRLSEFRSRDQNLKGKNRTRGKFEPN
jgi:hypothetical protein